MWWVPLATACSLGLMVLALHHWHQRRQLDGARVYRAKFVQLVSQLDSITASVNHLGSFIKKIEDEPMVLDYYESNLRVLETLLLAIHKLPPFGRDPSTLDSAFFLVKDCQVRVGRTKKAFRSALRGRKVELSKLYGDQQKAVTTGCYFCSRPVVSNRFSKVRVKLDDDVKEVMSCFICREELENTKKVKVLYFMKDGQPVHWSQVPDYQPSEDYWNINKREHIRKTKKLELVHSEHKPLDKDPSK